ncbi:M1 family metallopeptidase [Chondromyces apiculatus]|uniref:M1 family metallopeptidase n=1 Tax=Chondromyces apiculatus TaxID=51 RepID=UPI0006932C34|nr:M1 family metallopeptidase [Chondromyces apiculatus]
MAFGVFVGGLSGCGAHPRTSAPSAEDDRGRGAQVVLRGKETPAAGYDVLDYDASLRLVPETRAISGRVRISVKVRAASPTLDLAAEGMILDAVREGGDARAHGMQDGRLRIPLEGAAPGTTRTIEIAYHAWPSRGLRFGKDAVFTVFHTERWLPSSDLPGDKATLTLRLTAPAGLTVVASGDPVAREPLPEGLERHTFRLGIPHAAYLYGFAAGEFHEASRAAGKVGLRFLSTERSGADLERVFTGTEEMLRFFEGRAGVPYPFAHYTQVLVQGGSPQEVAGFAVLPADYAESVLSEPREDWMIAHELAHAWWGNLVTCAGWADFWLNEAFATFMVAAYKEQRWGADEYGREVLLARRSYGRIRQRGEDRALAFPGPVRAKDVSGPISYAKGSAVLYLLRHQLGERAFWAGVKAFVQDNAGGAVTSDALQAAMAAASGERLDGFFQQWVHGTGVPEVVVRHREEGRSLVFEVEQRQQGPWSFPLQLAVETDAGRESRTVAITAGRQEVRFPLAGALRSARADDGGHLPFAIEHPRPAPMLLQQLRHEPDVAGRADALERLSGLCRDAGETQECAAVHEAMRERAEDDTSRLVRKMAADALAP